MWTHYNKREFRTVHVPEKLVEILDGYCQVYKLNRTEVFDLAVFKLMAMWGEGKRQEVENALVCNPPPDSKKTISVSFRFTGDESFRWACDLEQDKAIVRSTDSFILRTLSWFLREKGVLDRIEIPPGFLKN
jgi:hypothetical protein